MTNKVLKWMWFLILVFFIYSLVKGHYEGEDFRKNSKDGIGRYVARRNYPKTNVNFFAYYVDGTRRRVSYGDLPKKFYKANIGKFYKIKYAEKYEDMIIVLLDQEVTDTVAILKAGFSSKDLKKK
jgi:hypothetical protein